MGWAVAKKHMFVEKGVALIPQKTGVKWSVPRKMYTCAATYVCSQILNWTIWLGPNRTEREKNLFSRLVTVHPVHHSYFPASPDEIVAKTHTARRTQTLSPFLYDFFSVHFVKSYLELTILAQAEGGPR